MRVEPATGEGPAGTPPAGPRDVPPAAARVHPAVDAIIALSAGGLLFFLLLRKSEYGLAWDVGTAVAWAGSLRAVFTVGAAWPEIRGRLGRLLV